MPDLIRLISVLTEARGLIDLPTNDFAWSYWDDREMALAEIDGILAELRGGTLPRELTLQVLFAPTGPLQEVSLSSGWGSTFVELARRFDEAMAGDSCTCLIMPSHHLTHLRDLGMDSRFADVSLLQCPDCGRQWLRYYYEVEAFSGSGRWYLGQITPAQLASLDAEGARGMLERLDWYYYGGSYYEGRSGRASGAIVP